MTSESKSPEVETEDDILARICAISLEEAKKAQEEAKMKKEIKKDKTEPELGPEFRLVGLEFIFLLLFC